MNVKMDRKILEYIMEFLKLDVFLDNIVVFFRRVVVMKEENEKVVFV